jgi:hypothetical protein
MVHGYWQLNVASMAWTIDLVEVAGRASEQLIVSDWTNSQRRGSPYGESPHEPSAGSYRPPGTGFSKLSKVLSFSIRFTDMAWTSLGDRNVNSTLSTSDEIGCEMFMMTLAIELAIELASRYNGC